MDIAYKVVRLQDNRLFSVSLLPTPFWTVEYRLGIKTVPNFEKSKLFVFKDLDKAKKWCTFVAVIGKNVDIYECQVENPIPATHCGCCKYHNFWDYHWTPEDDTVSEAPDGTYWADSVTLTKLVPLFRCNL